MSEKLFPGSGGQRSVMLALREVSRDRCWLVAARARCIARPGITL